jgi:hypothetical protein
MAIVKHEEYVKFDFEDIHNIKTDNHRYDKWIDITLKDNTRIKSRDTVFNDVYLKQATQFIAFKSRVYYWLSTGDKLI